MQTEQDQVIVVRLSGTMSTKSPQTRNRFNQRLESNIRDALSRAGIAFEFEREWTRFFVRADDERAPDVIASVCGVQGVRPSLHFEWTSLDEVVDRGVELFGERVDGRTFAVRTRRVGERAGIPFDSPEVNRVLGSALCECGGDVDLDNPDVEVHLEIHQDSGYFFDDEIPGPGGLPAGVEGRALTLISGGFDSAIAAWKMLKRGIELDFLFFNLGGPPHERGMRKVLTELSERWLHGYEPSLQIVDLRPMVAEMKVHASGHYWQLLLKRVMMRAAHRIAEIDDYPALITGEAIGQVSTQTMENLAAITRPIDTPILRPLVGYNKEEITELARKIGTYEVSKGTPEFCALDGGRPVTKSTSAKLDAQEDAIDMSLLDALIEDRRFLAVRELTDDEQDDEVRIDAIPQDAAVVDLRSEAQYESWHYPDAIHLDFDTALSSFGKLPAEPTWVFYCEVGLKSALIAEKMRQVGADAYSFLGGVNRLRKQVEVEGDG